MFLLKAIWKLIKPLSISCSQVPPFLHYGSMQSQLRLCSLTHWAIHHRWRRLLWKLAAILPLGKNHLNRAKMAPGKPCDAKDFFAFIFGQPCLSCRNRITNLFYLAKHWAIRAHFIIMTEQCVTNLANSVWKWIGRERDKHREKAEMWWVGTPAWGLSGWPGFGPTLCSFQYFMGFKFCSWPI